MGAIGSHISRIDSISGSIAAAQEAVAQLVAANPAGLLSPHVTYGIKG